jgi:glycosyltransferase involved in cell wall biosynthesis
VRIALLTDCLSELSGTESLIVNTCLALTRAGVAVILLGHNRYGPPHPHWVSTLVRHGVVLEVAEHRSGPDGDAELGRWMQAAIRRHEPDLVHAIPFAPVGHLWLTFDDSARTPVVGSQTTQADATNPWLTPDNLPRVDDFAAILVQCPSQAMGVRRYLRYQGRIHVVPTLVLIPPEERTAIQAEELFKARRLGCIARLRYEKGIEFLLATLSLLEGRYADVTVSVYGETPERERVEAVARSLGVEHRLDVRGTFTGNDEITAVIRRHLIFVLPSLFEGFPGAVLEALGRGRIILASDVGCLRDTLQATDAGILVRKGDTRAMASAVCGLLDDPMNLLNRSRAALDLYAQSFAEETVTAALLGVYRKVIGH